MPIKPRANFAPIENYLVDTDKPETQWAKEVNKELFDKKKKPTNNMMTVSRTLQFASNGDNGFTQSIQVLTEGANGFFVNPGSGAVDPRYNNFLYAPSTYGLNFVNNIKLGVLLNFLTENIPIGEPPPDSDYSVDFYVTLYKLSGGDSLFQDTVQNKINFPENQYLQVKSTLTYTLSTDSFSMDTYPVLLNLNNTFDRPRLETGFFDFSTNQDQITPSQYQELTTTSFPIECASGFNNTQYLALSTANKAHFDYNFFDISGGVAPPEERIGAYSSSWALNITYFGLTANYKPITN